MAGIFKWLFGRSPSGDARKVKTAREECRGKDRSEPDPEIIGVADPSLPGQTYFTQLERLTSSVSAKDYPAAAEAARASLPLLRNWLKVPRGAGQRLDIRIPALSQGGTMMAITGDREGLCELRRLVQDFDHLDAYAGRPGKRGGWKLVITPDGRTERPRSRVDSALVKAIAWAHRWQRLLEGGASCSLSTAAT